MDSNKDAMVNDISQIVDYELKAAQNFKATIELVSQPEFHLTGSRSVGRSISATSDYDFFISEKEWNMLVDPEIVVKCGLSRKNHYYNSGGDPSICDVYEFEEKIDIQVIKDEYYPAKVQAQKAYEILMHHLGPHLFENLNKYEARLLWKDLIVFCDYLVQTNGSN